MCFLNSAIKNQIKINVATKMLAVFLQLCDGGTWISLIFTDLLYQLGVLKKTIMITTFIIAYLCDRRLVEANHPVIIETGKIHLDTLSFKAVDRRIAGQCEPVNFYLD